MPASADAANHTRVGTPVQRAKRIVASTSSTGKISTISNTRKRMSTPTATAALLVLTTLPDRAGAEALARELLVARLAACVQIGATLHSLYHWRGEIETAQETPVAVKTRGDLY